MLEILAQSNLPHQLILVAVHASELAHVSKGILQPIGKLECIHIPQPVLNMGINHQFGKTEDLTAKMKSIAKSAFLSFLRRESLHWLQVEVVIQMKIVQVFPMDEQV